MLYVVRYKSEFGFTLVDRDVIVDDVRVRGVGMSAVPEELAPPSGKGTTPLAEKASIYIQEQYCFFPFLLFIPFFLSVFSLSRDVSMGCSCHVP